MSNGGSPCISYRTSAGRRAVAITSDVVLAFVDRRQGRGASNAEINRELSILKRAFRLGVRSRKVEIAPTIDLLREQNARQGFFERADFEAIAAHLTAEVAAAARF